MYTVARNRVGVHDAPGGQLRFQMLRGSMSASEARAIQNNLNKQQMIFLNPSIPTPSPPFFPNY